MRIVCRRERRYYRKVYITVPHTFAHHTLNAIESTKMTTENPAPLLRDVFALATNAATLSGDLPIADLTRMRPELTQTTGALHYTVSGQLNEKKHPLLHVQITGELNMVCQRCLEEVTQTIDIDNTLHLVANEADLDSEEDEINAILAGDESPEKIVGSTSFDLLNLLEDEVILSLPQAVTHDICEKTLPTTAGEKPSPFAVLAKLKS